MLVLIGLVSVPVYGEESQIFEKSYMELLIDGDEQGAYELLSKRAMLGDASAQSNLGVMYRRGIGTEVDHEKAFILFGLASNQGNAYGLYNLGEMYEIGEFVEQDLVKALTHYEMAMGSSGADAKVSISAMAAIMRIHEINPKRSTEEKKEEQGRYLREMGMSVM